MLAGFSSPTCERLIMEPMSMKIIVSLGSISSPLHHISHPYEPLAKLRLHAEFFILRGNKSRLPRPRRAWCFRNESPAESGRGHASTRDAIKHLGSRSMVSFPDATGRDRAAHGTTPAAGGRA